MISNSQSRSSVTETCGADVRYPLHQREEVKVDADAHSLFAHLDNHRRLASHMQKPSLMSAGATMQVETDARQGQAIGSVIRVTGRVFGVNLSVEEVVTERAPPLRKVWETRGTPRLLVMGSYRMGFTISPRGDQSCLIVFIDYQIPSRGFAHALALLFGRTYAAWCTRRMATDAAAAFTGRKR